MRHQSGGYGPTGADVFYASKMTKPTFKNERSK